MQKGAGGTTDIQNGTARTVFSEQVEFTLKADI